MKEQEAYQYQRNQLVLVCRTAKELQEAHTKLTDKYDHLARVNRVFANQTTYEITYLYSGKGITSTEGTFDPFMKTSKTMMTPLSHHDSQLFPWLCQRRNSTFVARGCLALAELAPGVCYESEECCVMS